MIQQDLKDGLLNNTGVAMAQLIDLQKVLPALEEKSLRRTQLLILANIGMSIATLAQAYILNLEPSHIQLLKQ